MCATQRCSLPLPPSKSPHDISIHADVRSRFPNIKLLTCLQLSGFFSLNHMLTGTAADLIFMRLKYVRIWYFLRREKFIQEGSWGFVCVYVDCVRLSLISVSPNCEISTETFKGIICLLSTSSLRTLVWRCVKMGLNSIVNQCAAHLVCVCVCVRKCVILCQSLLYPIEWGSRRWMNG